MPVCWGWFVSVCVGMVCVCVLEMIYVYVFGMVCVCVLEMVCVCMRRDEWNVGMWQEVIVVVC